MDICMVTCKGLLMKEMIRRYAFCILAFGVTVLLTSCSSSTQQETLDASDPEAVKHLVFKGISLMEDKKFQQARDVFAAGLRNNPKNCSLNTLNALSYQMQGRGNNEKLLANAVYGYHLASKYCPNDPWPYYYTAVASLQTKRFLAADKNFKMAAELLKSKKSHPPLTKLYRGYLYSAYRSGQIQDGKQALAELEKLDPTSPLIKPLKSLYASLDDGKVAASNNAKAPGSAEEPKNPHNMLFIDVVLVLSREVSQRTDGTNLLDTLTAGVGSDGINLSGSKDNGAAATSTFDWSLTIPEVTYELNVFNHIAEHDQILARPTVIAQDGKQAKYFVGNDLYIGLSGSEYSSFEEIPLGLTLNVTPTFNDDGTIALKADVEREMLLATNDNASGFQNSTESVKQSSSSTVTLNYDQTAVFGTLSEATDGQVSNRTPFLGNLPIIKKFFNKKEHDQASTQLIILMTPRRYISFDTKNIYPGTKALKNYYLGLISPSTNMVQVVRWLRILDIYYRPERLAPSLYAKETFDSALTSEYEIENGEPRDLRSLRIQVSDYKKSLQ